MLYSAKARRGSTEVPRNASTDETDCRLNMDMRQRIWIDIDNSPHVLFFIPIIEELQRRGHEVILTARDAYQVCELLDIYHLSCKIVGKHYGKNRAAKILGTCIRAAQLFLAVFNKN